MDRVFPIFAMIGVFIAVANGMVPTYLSKYFGHLGQGKVMGLQTSTFCVTNVIIASLGGPLSILSSRSVVVMLVTRQRQEAMMSGFDEKVAEVANV